MPPKKAEDDASADSRKRGLADEAEPPGGRSRKGARAEPPAATAKAAEDGQGRSAAGGRTKGLRVKLAGAGNCTRRDPAAMPPEEPLAEEGGAAPDMGAMEPAADTAAGSGADAAPTGAKFQPGSTVLLFNGSLRYEAEIVKARDPSNRRTSRAAAGSRLPLRARPHRRRWPAGDAQ